MRICRSTTTATRGQQHDRRCPVDMANSTPDLSGVEFATSADGLPVARIGDLVLAMVFSPSGFSYLGRAVAIRRPLAELTRADFIGHDGRIADEAEFRSRVAEATGHNAISLAWIVYGPACQRVPHGVDRRWRSFMAMA